LLSKEEAKTLIENLASNQEFRIKNADNYDIKHNYSWLEMQQEILKVYQLVLKILNK
jgi:hypothetical protein